MTTINKDTADLQHAIDTEFIKEVQSVAQASTCNRAHVGAIVARGEFVISSGINTSAKGLPTCDEVGHLIIEGHCCRTIHAEANAIYMALKYGYSLKGVTIYVTHSPCVHCRKLIIQTGIQRVVYLEPYGSTEGLSELTAGIEWVHYKE